MRYFLTVSFLVAALKLTAFGIGDWEHETPGGNVMSDPGDGTHLTIRKTGDEILGISKWYFYKNFIVGELGDGHFIVDESTGEKLMFHDKNKWIKEIQSRGLEPIVWTRWYTDNWVDSDWLVIWLFFGFFVSIPLTLFFMFALYRTIVKERFRFTSFYTIFVLSVVIVVGVTLLLDKYPGSV